MTLRIFVITCLLMLSACAKDKAGIGETDAASAELYQRGHKLLNQGNYSLAIEQFETLESRYPFGSYAQQSQLETAYSHYKLSEPDSAIAAANQFIKLNPEHPHVDYAYYLKGIANFSRYDGMLDGIIKKDLSLLDMNPLNQSFADFKQLITQFPESPYAQDAQQRMLFLRNVLAGHELSVAQYYARRGAYVAVVNRCRYLLEHYDGADSIPKALVLMAQAYEKLGLNEPFNNTVSVLEHNFPDSLNGLTKKK
jgi:outer membrane protein assembly factor BamD